MTEVNINFIYSGTEITIQCKKDEYMKDIFNKVKANKKSGDIYFLYNGSKINEEIKLEEVNNSDNEIKILVYEYDSNKKEVNNEDDSNRKILLNNEINLLKKQNQILLDNQKLLLEQISKVYDILDKTNINSICLRCKGTGNIPIEIVWDDHYNKWMVNTGYCYSVLKYYSGYSENCGYTSHSKFILENCPLCKGVGLLNMSKYTRCTTCTEVCGYKNSDSSHQKRGFFSDCKGLGFKEI